MGAGSAAVDPALRAIWAEVLGVDELDVENDFFALGGNSLLATQITARVADVLGVEVALDALFEAPTLGEYAERVQAASGDGGATARPREHDDNGTAGRNGNGRRGGGLRALLRGRRDGGGARRADTPAHAARAHRSGAPEGALSALQGSAWATQRFQPDARPHVGQVFSVQGPLDVAALERAFTTLAARHEALRTSFPLEGHRPRARVHDAAPVTIDVIGNGRRMRDDEVRAHVDAASSEPFAYEQASPWRARLIRTGRSAYVLVFLLHEIVCDGQAYDLLVRELGQLYATELAGEPSPLTESAPQYGDVVRAHGPRLGGEPDAGAEHWRAALAGAPLALTLPHERLEARPGGGHGAYVRRSVQLPAALVARLHALAQEEAATSFMLHLAALVALLHRWSGETDLIVRSPAANRARAEWERTVGFFSMVLPLRIDAGDDPTFRELLRRTRETALRGFRHASHAPEDNMLHAIDGMRGLRGWSVLFRQWDPTTEQPLELTGASAKPYREDAEAGRLVLVVTERSDGRTVAQLSSASDALDAHALGELLRHYERLLEQVAEEPDRRIGSEIELLSATEREQLGGGAGGRTRGAADGTDGLHGLVAAGARRTPDAVAFDAGDATGTMTYAQLDARAGAVATYLRGEGVAAGAPVGLRLEPGGDLLVGLLGVLKAGAVAVPLLEPELEDDPLAGLPPLTAVLDGAALVRAAGAAADADGALEANPASAALIVRTAGVGGWPRAIELTHATLLAAAQRERDALRLTAADRVAHVPGRGAWSWALAPWAALVAGATVVGPERAPQPRGATSPSGWLEANAVSVAAMDAWLAGALLARAAAIPGTLRLLCVQGAGPLDVPAEAVGRGRLAVLHGYGLTEAGGFVCDVARSSALATSGARNAGPSLRARVLDPHGHVAPAGVIGALELDDGAGDGPLATGDLARRRADGALELVGRAHDELRWRGVRLMPILHDLEAALAQHPAVQAATACWEPAREALVACVVPRRAQLPERAQLDEWLQRTMADWILPAAYATVDALPLRADGLPDRAALAASPAVAQALAGRDGAEPRSATERRLADVWKRVLGVRRVGAHDNFFAQGGMLLDGVELCARARAAGVAIEPGDVLFRPTLAELAAIADARR